MDAVCAASAIVGLIFNCATAVKGCNDLRGKYKNADQTLRSISTEGSTLRASLLQLHHLMLRDPDALSARWDVESMLPQTFETAIGSFTSVLAGLLSELDKFNGKAASPGLALTRNLKIKLLWNEAAMQDVLVQLRAQQQSLQFLLTILQMGTISEIRAGIRKQRELLRRIARSTKNLERQQVESLKRKSGSTEVQSSENLSSNAADSDELDEEPPAKRRSLSPEKDLNPSSSPARTRSGKVYHPVNMSAKATAVQITDQSVKDVHEDTRRTGASTVKPQQQRTRRPAHVQSQDQEHGGQRIAGGYSLGRSFSPSSSTWGSPFTFSAPHQQPSDIQTPPETPQSEHEKIFTPVTLGKDKLGARVSQPKRHSTLAKSDTTNASNGSDEMYLDLSATSESLPRVLQVSKLSKLHSYRSAEVESDSESDHTSDNHIQKSIERPDGYTPASTLDDGTSPMEGIVSNLVGSAFHVDEPQYTRPAHTQRGCHSRLTQSTMKEDEKSGNKTRHLSWNYPRNAIEDDEVQEYVEYFVNGVLYCVPARKSTRETYEYNETSQKYYSDPFKAPKYYINGTLKQGDEPRRRRRSTKPASKPSTTTPKLTAPPQPKIIRATKADALKHNIPPGYSLKNWDPSENPILLLGSVFDGNSLGKWIYDWTVYHHGPATPVADMAGEFWLLLIQLAGKVKRAEECMPRIRLEENREMVEDFIEAGERLTEKLKKLLKMCENPMLRAGKKSNQDKATLGKSAGTVFIDTIFGPDCQLEQTEKLMSCIRLWNLRFDANCEDVLRRPGQ